MLTPTTSSISPLALATFLHARAIASPSPSLLPAPTSFTNPAPLKGHTDHPLPLLIPHWQTFPHGPNNAITDVPGIRVGQVSIQQDGPLPLRTGITTIVPDAESLSHGKGNLATVGLPARSVCLNGNGELTGSHFINEFGVLNGPIVLTNTRSVGSAIEGVDAYFDKHYPGQWSCMLSVVGECYDGFFSTPVALPPELVETAIDQAQAGPVDQGQAGAGTGMRSFGLHAGIGSSSRQIVIEGKPYTIGVLVNMNHSRLPDLNPTIANALENRVGSLPTVKQRDDLDQANTRQTSRQGSIQVVIATDLPLNPNQLEEMAKRAGLGIGNLGSCMGTSSGDFATAFSTANGVDMSGKAPAVMQQEQLHPDWMTPIYQATVEAVTEAQTNALVASHS